VGVPHIGLRIRASLILGEIREHRPQTIIDAGSGNGLYTLEFAARGYIVHGIELNQDKVSRVARYAREAGLANASLQVADLTKLALVSQQADMVVCSDVLEHIGDDASAICSLGALTRPGGILVLTVPRVSPFAARVENNFDHVRIGYTEEQLRAMLESVGFQILKTRQFFKMFGRIAWAADRSLRHFTSLKALLFWPLFLLAKLDTVIPNDLNAGGILVVARASSGEKAFSQALNV
jgi:2-polyprenyl-3-methyl-5-hydroxy-6-metoxy-1,4-benzoquinol methylase